MAISSAELHRFTFDANRFDGTYLSEASHEGEAVIAPAEYPDVAIPISLPFRFSKP